MEFPYGQPVNPKDPKDPFERVNASALRAYLDMGLPDLAHAYLLRLGITPKLVNQTLAEYGVLPPLLGRPGKHPPISDIQLLSHAAGFMREWELGEYRPVYAPCHGVQALRLFKRWLAKKAVKPGRKDDDLLGCLLRLPGVQQRNNPDLPDFGAFGQSDKKSCCCRPTPSAKAGMAKTVTGKASRTG